MTRLPSPSSRSSSEISLPLDLNLSLTARLQAVLFQPPATDCAVLPNSEVLGAYAPSFLPSLAKEGLVSSSGIGGGHDTVQLAQQPGKSKNEDQPLLVVQGIEDPSFVSDAGLLSELVLSNDAPFVSLLSGSDMVPFSPSAFMNVDTRVGFSTFGGVRQVRGALPMNLHSRSEIFC